MRKFFKRQVILPFETCFAFFCVYSGIAGIVSFGPVNDAFRQVLGHKKSIIFNVGFLVAGLALYFGLGLAKRNIEAFGLITIIMSLLVRVIAVFSIAGISSSLFNNYVYAFAFIFACIIRARSLFTRKTLVETQEISQHNSDDYKRIHNYRSN